ncbi:MULTISPECIES: transporter [Nitrospira]|uniref:Transporter n=2 Tax=Nitrospira TaxID=1234 RepID=A0AA86MZ36_9BACT|nr:MULTISPECIES: transporter [Nitrospira]CAE6732110.1 conserved exported hypothetical protein [Nitrospira defluvii]CAI4031720.1 hypothetical protein DNFV4_02139 [Nitrospira tepida]
MRLHHRMSLILLMITWVLCTQAAALASCGAVSCFVVIGAQQQVPQQGVLTVNGIYNYTPMRLLGGTTGIIPAADQARQRLILDHHQEVRTITQTYTLDLNYGVTDRFAMQVTIPYLKRTHIHLDEIGESPTEFGERVNFADNGIGDVRVTAKYNLLPTLRHMVVMGLGLELPTGDTRARDSSGQVLESSGQLGRGNVGLIGSIYQTYELIPHRLNQFAFASYRHTFRNRDGYQFGDEYQLNVGLNLITTPWLVLISQFNYRYLTHDNVTANLEQSAPPFAGDEPVLLDPRVLDRRVPNTGSTYLAYTPGFQLALGELIKSRLTEATSVYFMTQIPLARDANNNLAQGTSFIFGLTRSFQLVKPQT